MTGEKKTLRELRRGTPPHKRVHIGSPKEGYDVMVVVLSADECLDIEEATAEYCNTRDKRVNEAVKNQFYNALLVSKCMRSVDDLTTPMAESMNEVMECMDLEDISRVVNAYSELMMNKAPKLELLSQEQLDELKKHLEVTPLSDLSTVLLVHLANCHRTLVSES